VSGEPSQFTELRIHYHGCLAVTAFNGSGQSDWTPWACTSTFQLLEFAGQIGGFYGNQLAVQGTYAYVAGSNGLVVVDIANPATPRELARYTVPPGSRMPRRPQDLAVVGSFAYIAAEAAGLRIVDISNPSNPREVGSLELRGIAQSLDVSGNYAYVADAVGGDGRPLKVIDISNPANPREVGGLDLNTPVPLAVTVAGNYAYLSADGLQFIDVSNPLRPLHVGGITTPGMALTTSVVGRYLYLADFDGGLRIFDVANPALPREVGAFTDSLAARHVLASGSRAYLSDGLDGLRLLHMANLANPTQLMRYDTPGYAQYSALVGDYLYVADGVNGLLILRVYP
jgi:hypothetical protein